MRTCLTLLLFSLLCTCVRAQNNSSATMVVAMNPDVVLLHISSAEGYEEIGYISPELYRCNGKGRLRIYTRAVADPHVSLRSFFVGSYRLDPQKIGAFSGVLRTSA